MLGINFSEWLLIVVVGFVVIGPKELPVVLRHIMGFIREMRALTSGIRAQFHEAVREAGLDDVMNEMHDMRRTTTIIDLDGKPQKAYDVRELRRLSDSRLSDDPRSDDPMIRLSDDRQVTHPENATTDQRSTDQRSTDQRSTDQRPTDQRSTDQRPTDQRSTDQRQDGPSE